MEKSVLGSLHQKKEVYGLKASSKTTRPILFKYIKDLYFRLKYMQKSNFFKFKKPTSVWTIPKGLVFFHRAGIEVPSCGYDFKIGYQGTHLHTNEHFDIYAMEIGSRVDAMDSQT